MPCFSAISTRTNSRQALGELMGLLTPQLAGRKAALACLFGTAEHTSELGDLAREIRTQGIADQLIATTAESVAGADREVERSAGLALWLMDIPGVNVEPVRIGYEDGLFLGWNDPPAEADESSRALILFADPFSFPTDEFLLRINERRKGFRIIGGMASATQSPGNNRLIINDDTYRTGAVGLLVSGNITIRTIVSQGCRAIGHHLLVTKAERNLIRELGRRPSLEVLQEIFEELEGPDRERVRRGLHLGRVINEYQATFGPGDFLIRNVMGADSSAAIAVNDNIRVGQTVQFHVRDAATADEDLRTLLARLSSTPQDTSPQGALLFTCNGRGSRLFDMPNHDITTIHEMLGPVPTAGFFAMGEIGPIGNQNFIHGFTASIGLFYDKQPPLSRPEKGSPTS